MQPTGRILPRYQAKETYENPVDLFLEPKWTIWDCSDIIPFLKNAMKKLRDTLESGLQPQEVNVTLDPDTAELYSLKNSEDRKSMTEFKGILNNHSVFGCQMFSSGRHFWDVIVDGTGGWDVGVISKSENFENVDQAVADLGMGREIQDHVSLRKL